MTAFYGPAFLARHGDELVPLVREFERAFVDPWTRLLPLWASPSGRRLQTMYSRMKEVIEDEVRGRLERCEKGAEAGEDYVSFLLNMDSRAEEFFPCYGEHLVSPASL
jgi:sterol 14-demethylase